MKNDSLFQEEEDEKDSYWASFRKKFRADSIKNGNEVYVVKNMLAGIICGIIAVLIGGFTYGLGTVTLASSIFLGLFGGHAVNKIADSLLNNYKKSEQEDGLKAEEALKKRIIATLVIGCVFAAATVAISVLTFGVGLIPLGTFAAAALITAFALTFISSFVKAFKFVWMHKEQKARNKQNEENREIKAKMKERLENFRNNVAQEIPFEKNNVDKSQKVL